MKTKISLEGMKFRAFHGVTEQERIIGGDYCVDVSYIVNNEAPETDALKDTVSYADVYDVIKTEMMSPSQLIENKAFSIRTALYAAFPLLSYIKVTVSKLNPPVSGEVAKVSATISEEPDIAE
ncbi:MAG: dihydroneopterin aldolase [Tannerella sp.]|jgi:dihydroneopterin aldolase|nr:dihydroneopterin aldolase [Tannerella sp.]